MLFKYTSVAVFCRISSLLFILHAINQIVGRYNLSINKKNDLFVRTLVMLFEPCTFMGNVWFLFKKNKKCTPSNTMVLWKWCLKLTIIHYTYNLNIQSNSSERNIAKPYYINNNTITTNFQSGSYGYINQSILHTQCMCACGIFGRLRIA